MTKLRAGNFTVAVADKSAKDNFRLQGAGLSRSTSVLKKQTATWIVELKKGVPVLVRRQLEAQGIVPSHLDGATEGQGLSALPLRR